VLLHNLQEEQLQARGGAATFVKDALALRLAGDLVTRISMRNSRLRKGLDNIRDHNKPVKRERFEALLWEL
jgi:hypothetical protein